MASVCACCLSLFTPEHGKQTVCTPCSFKICAIEATGTASLPATKAKAEARLEWIAREIFKRPIAEVCDPNFVFWRDFVSRAVINA